MSSRPAGTRATGQGRHKKPLPLTDIIDPRTGEPLPRCRYCQRSLRPKKTTAKEYPLTVPRCNDTCCSSPMCRDQNREAKGLDVAGDVDSAAGLQQQYPVPALEWYLQRRRMRLLNDALAVRATSSRSGSYEQFTR